MIVTNSKYEATKYLASIKIFQKQPFTVIDVGCSGGLHPRWRVLGNSLQAWCIDPLVSEIERLRANEKNPQVHYWAGYIGLPKDRSASPDKENWRSLLGRNWKRTSAAWGIQLLSKPFDDDQRKMSHNRWTELELADSSIRLGIDEYVKKNNIDNVDFIKIDIDGDDLEALHSCEGIIGPQQVLGFELEVNYSGTHRDNDNTLHNTDRFVRRHGFSLSDLSVNRYSKKSLPAPFNLRMPAQTQWGAPFQGDAIYTRDILSEIDGNTSLSPIKLIKLVTIYELFGLPDCAAEILTAFRDRLSDIVDVNVMLDLLTPKVNGVRMTYKEYLKLFESDVESFYPQPGSAMKSKCRMGILKIIDRLFGK